MLLAEVKLLHETSSLSLSVGGALKDVSQIAPASGRSATRSRSAVGRVASLWSSPRRWPTRSRGRAGGGPRRSPRARRYARVEMKAEFDDALDDDDLKSTSTTFAVSVRPH